MQINKKRLEDYRSEKQEIQELRTKLQNLRAKDYIGNDVIMDYRSGYPVPQSVVGVDYSAYMHKSQRLQAEIARLEQRCMEVEKWIDDIPDSLTRRIFRLYYEEGKRQQDIAKQLHIDRSVISRKINNYMKTQAKAES